MKLLGRSFVFIFAGLSVVSLSQTATAQTANACTATNALTVGNYGFVLNAGTFLPVTTNPPGTTSSRIFEPLAVTPPGTNPFSNTELGRLLSGLNGNTSGATTGVLYFDGAGNIFASQISAGAANTNVGTYTVDANCGISVTLGDVFSNQNPVRQFAFTGALANAGSEIDLIPTSQFPTNTNQNTKPITPPSSIIQLVKMPTPATCTAASLTGSYLLLGTGFQGAGLIPTSPATAQGFPFIARVRFDGNGNIVPESTNTTGLSLIQYTGSYTVNTNCTGTMTITGPAASPTGTTTGVTGGTGGPGTGAATTTQTGRQLTVPFLIIGPLVQVNSNGVVAFQTVSSLRSSILFSFASQDQIVSGIGKAQ